jgi:hypothetical protein
LPHWTTWLHFAKPSKADTLCTSVPGKARREDPDRR